MESQCLILDSYLTPFCGIASKDHAVTMSKFAQECLIKLSKSLITWEETLGEETKTLSMRVGLHSGPVTVSHSTCNSSRQNNPLIISSLLFDPFAGGCATWRKKQVPGKTVCYNAICFGISGFHAPRIFMYTAQLFGDTVDVASRMESTGIPSMIQVSQDTANALIARARGKGSWRTPREDKIVAKGNGEMQTYFCGL